MAKPRYTMSTCPLCGEKYPNGPHRYDGCHSKLFDLWVCSNCWDANWDGWAPHYERFLLDHLKKKGLPIPKRNAKGWFPRS